MLATPKIFVSYRRADTGADAGRLVSDLAAEFGSDTVFKDVDDIPLGANIGEHIDEAVQNSAIMLVLVGPAWSPDRLANESDWVRLEVESAHRFDIPIIPVRFRRAELPPKSSLPESIAWLADRNAAEIEHQSWKRDLAPLLDAIRNLLPANASASAAASNPPMATKPNVPDGSFAGASPLGFWFDERPMAERGQTVFPLGELVAHLTGEPCRTPRKLPATYEFRQFGDDPSSDQFIVFERNSEDWITSSLIGQVSSAGVIFTSKEIVGELRYRNSVDRLEGTLASSDGVVTVRLALHRQR